MFGTGDPDGDRIGPVSLHQRGDDEQHEAETAPRFARRPAHCHGAKHGRRQRVREQGGRESVQRIVRLRHAVRAGLDGTLTEAVVSRFQTVRSRG